MAKISTSSELITNYLQAQIMRPDARMQALQTGDGRALLLSIGTDDALYATLEQPGERYGWQRHDLSKGRVEADFGGRTNVRCVSFAVAQGASFFGGRAAVDKIHLAMVIRDGDADHLYLSLNNSASDTAWINQPTWMACPYDDLGHTRDKLQIADVYLGDATDSTYIVVDVIRDPSSTRQLRFRYYIDPLKADGQAWQAHDVLADVEVAGHDSALGRRFSPGRFQVDGIYTAGQVAGVAQLIYAPLYNVFDRSAAPSPTILHLPGNAVPDAIATCRKADNTSDLYVSAGETLYYFASDQQDGSTSGVAVGVNPLFGKVRNLFAFLHDASTVMVWGLNSSGQIFYTTCKLTDQARQDQWTMPVPILSSVEQVAPFVNRAYSATCLFAHTGNNRVVKAVKSPANLLWTFIDIALPSLDTKIRARSFDSYTTRIVVKDDDGVPLAHTKVRLSTSGTLTSVFINNIYYILGTHQIELETDASGALNVVEAVSTLVATQFKIAVGNNAFSANPMEQPFRKLTALRTADALKGATIQYQDGSTKPFVPSHLSNADLYALAKANGDMAMAYDSLRAGGPVAALSAADFSHAKLARSERGVIVDIGDFFAWLGDCIRRGVDTVIEFVKDVARNVWEAVVRIAGEIYRVALTAVEDVVEFAVWVYNKVKIAIAEVIKFLSYVFDVSDMRRTKEVMKHCFKLHLAQTIDGIDKIKHEFDAIIDHAQGEVRRWAGMSDDWAGLGADGNHAVSQHMDSGDTHSVAETFLANHFQANIGAATFDAEPRGHSPGLLEPLLVAIESEKAVLMGLVERVKALAENLPRMSGVDILKQLMGIVAEFGLASVKTIVNALLDILEVLARGVMQAFDAQIYIPVLSEILDGFGVPRFSMLDVLCWISAAPATIVHKITTSKAPFNNADAQKILDCTTYDALVAMLRTPPAPHRREVAAGLDAASGDWSSVTEYVEENRRTFLKSGQLMSGFLTLIPGINANVFDAAKSGQNQAASKVSGATAALAGGFNGIAINLSSYHLLADKKFLWLGRVTTGLRILSKLGFAFAAMRVTEDNKLKCGTVSAAVDAVLVLPGLVVSIAHFVELNRVSASRDRSISIVNEVANLTGFVSRIAYLGALVTPFPPKVYVLAGLGVADLCTSGLLIADGSIKPN